MAANESESGLGMGIQRATDATSTFEQFLHGLVGGHPTVSVSIGPYGTTLLVNSKLFAVSGNTVEALAEPARGNGT